MTDHYPTEDAYEAACRALEWHRAETERLRTLLSEALDGWADQVTTGVDGYYERSRIRREAGLTCDNT